MKTRKTYIIAAALLCIGFLGAVWLKWRGFRATSTPTQFETIGARYVRDFAILGGERRRMNPLANDSAAVEQGREDFIAQYAGCHGIDGRGRIPIGTNVYPRVPDLHSEPTRKLSDGEIHYFIENGIQLSGMPALKDPHGASAREAWKLVSYVRRIQGLSPKEQNVATGNLAAANYTGSQACQSCHADIYEHWRKTPMANVIRDPREHPDAIIPDLTTNKIAPFSKDQVAFVYGSKWKQRYFTKSATTTTLFPFSGISATKSG